MRKIRYLQLHSIRHWFYCTVIKLPLLFLEIDLLKFDAKENSPANFSANVLHSTFRRSQDLAIFLEAKLPRKDSTIAVGFYTKSNEFDTKYFELSINLRKGKGKLNLYPCCTVFRCIS